MRIKLRRDDSGIALIIVMIVIVVFAILAGGLAYSMKVETKLARNSTWDTELEWLGRSGIEYAKFLLTPCPGVGQQYDALNQPWAGGTGETNSCAEGMSLTDVHLGHGVFSVKIMDTERKFNINRAVQAPEILNQAMILMGIDAAEGAHIVGAVQDWIDRDNDTHVGSTDTESSYYLSLQPPYRAKNGPIDDLTEMMMIKGVTPAMFYGSGGGAGGVVNMSMMTANRFNRRRGEETSYPIGFVDLFTTLSAPQMNINTASPTVLQLMPDIDGNLAQAIVQTRAGPDGVEGNEDDMPFRSLGELANVPGMNRGMAGGFAKYFNTRSTTFEVEVDARIDQAHRTYYALLRRTGNQLLLGYLYWR